MENQNNDIDRLRKLVGTDNPFKVPEHYFDTLPGKVMNRIARRRRRIVIFRWAAAAMVAGIVATSAFMLQPSTAEQATVAETDNGKYIEDALEYTMIDNLDIASYLTEAE